MRIVCPQTDESMLSDTGIINVQPFKLRKKGKKSIERKETIYICKIGSCSVFIFTELNVIITTLSEHTHLLYKCNFLPH